MEDWKAISVLDNERRKYSSEEVCNAIIRGIEALYFEVRARELFKAVIKLLNKQKDSDTVLNMLTETVYYDEAECDGFCLINDILNLLDR